MKKNYIFISLLIFASALYAQNDIVNTLGANGNFIVNTSNTTNLFTLSSTSNSAHLLRLAPGTTSAFNVLNSNGNPVIHFTDAYSVDGLASMIIGSDPTTDWTGGSNYPKIQLQSDGIDNIFSMVTYGTSNSTINEINGYRGKGSFSSKATVGDGDILLNIKAFGYTTATGGASPGLYKSSEIVFSVDGPLTGGFPPGKIEFSTSDGITTGGGGGTTGDGTPEVRMTVKSNGVVNFTPLASDPTNGTAGDVYYNSTSNKLRVHNGSAWVDLH